MITPLLAVLPIGVSAEALPADTVVVNQSLGGAAGASENVKVGDVTYATVVGTTSFKTVNEALAAVKAGGTVILAAGTYTETVVVEKDVTIKGPKAGINPNVFTLPTDGSFEADMTQNPLRGEGEAVIASNWHMGMDATKNKVFECHNITVDGVAVTKGGMFRSNYGEEGYITLNYKNILVYDYTQNSGNGPFYCYSYYPNRSTNLYKRTVVAENIRFVNQVGTPGFNLCVDNFTAKGIYFDEKSTGKMFANLTFSDSTKSTEPVSVTITDSVFRQKTNQIMNANVTTGSGGHNFNSAISKRQKVTVTIARNYFVNNDSAAAQNNNIIVPQIDTENVYFEIYENNFISSVPASSNFISIHGATGKLALGEKFKIEKNRFVGIPTALSMANSTTEFDLSGNYFSADGTNPLKPVVVGLEKSTWWYLDKAMTLRSDTAGLALDGVPAKGTVDTAKKTIADTTDKDTYEFTIKTNAYNTVSVYADRDLKVKLENPVKLYKAESTLYVKISSNDGKAYEVYTATIKTSNPDKMNYDLATEVRFFGRTYNDGGTYFFNWSSSGFTFSFKGTGVKATIVSNAPGGANAAYIKVYVDGVEQEDIKLKSSSEVITLAKDLDPTKEHTVKVVKRTNARSSSAGVKSITLLSGEKLAPTPAKDKLIEFIGDSLTVGYSTVVGNATAWSTATEDSTKTYAEQIANYFGADYFVTAISGRGIVRNTGGDTDKLFPAIYPLLDAYNAPGVEYDFSLKPDVIIINLGTNDASGSNTDLKAEDFRTGLKAFLKDVRRYNPDAEILYTYGLTTTKFASDMQMVVSELRNEGDKKINYMTLDSCMTDEKALGHPKAEAYGPRGDAIIKKLETITGWKKSEGTETTKPAETTAEPTVTTEEPKVTEAPEVTTDTETTEGPEKKGCNGLIGASAAVMAAAIGAGAVLLKKKDEER